MALNLCVSTTLKCNCLFIFTISRPGNDTKGMTSLKAAKESPSGGEKLLRLLASGVAGSNEHQAKGNHTSEQSRNNKPLNFAQGKSTEKSLDFEDSSLLV